MSAEIQQSVSYANASEEEQTFTAALLRDGVALVNLQIADFPALAERIIAATGAMQPGRRRLQDAWRRIPDIRKVAIDINVLRMLKFAYGRRAIPFQTLNFCVGTEQRTHSDTIHFSSFPRNFMCGVWVAYEDTDESNGALHYYPGSHLLPAQALEDFGIGSQAKDKAAAYQRYEDGLAAYIQRHGLQKRVIHLRKGQALVWAANLLHGGEPIADTSRSRHSQVTHYYFEDCLYVQPINSDFHAGRIRHKKVFDIAKGEYVTSIYNGEEFRLPLISHLREFVDAKVIGVHKL